MYHQQINIILSYKTVVIFFNTRQKKKTIANNGFLSPSHHPPPLLSLLFWGLLNYCYVYFVTCFGKMARPGVYL